ncbi:MAG: (2Fe-2S)-binding protein [Spirochaetes bacterium]|nr:(2Fe-2S)-binding protein [Spirochaetota bacterium]
MTQKADHKPVKTPQQTVENKTLVINGKSHTIAEDWYDKNLIKYLREELNLKGTKNGCHIGACGACTVLINNRPRRSCITPVRKVLGSNVLTIEGVARSDGTLHPLQQAFLDAGAVQCGYCTPGMILTAYALLLSNPNPSRDEIRKALAANICRCTGYQQIIDAVELAASWITNNK